MIDITKPAGILFAVIALISLIGLMYSVVEFIRWRNRYYRNSGGDLSPFAVVGAVVIGILIMAGIFYCLTYIGLIDFSNRVNTVMQQTMK